MKKSLVSIINKQFSNRQSLFLKDPKSDIFVILNEKIYPLHKSFLSEAQYFDNNSLESGKVHLIEANLDQKYFELVIGYFYGKQLQFLRDWDILKVLNATSVLKTPALTKKILEDIKNNFDEYGFFLLMSIGQKFKLKWLQQKCQEELLLMGFQQINFNRYDLLQADKQMLIEIIKLHQLLRINQNIIGLKENQLKKIIKEYCMTNKLNDYEFNHICSFLITDGSQPPQKTSQLARKKSQSSTNNELTQSKRMKEMTNEEKKTQEVKNLHKINTQMQEKSSEMIEIIKNVKSSIEDSVKIEKRKESAEGNIEQNFKKFERVCQEQDAKYLSLKADMDKLHLNLKKSQEQDVEFSVKPIGSSTSSTKQNDEKGTRSRKMSETLNQKMFPEMPRLSRDLD